MTETDFVSNFGDWNLFEIWCLPACGRQEIWCFHISMLFALCPLRSVGVAGVTIVTGLSFLMAGHAPLHIVSINHFDRSFLYTCQTMAEGTVHPTLNMNPVREGNIFGKLVHAVPQDLPIRLDILNDFQSLRPFTHSIRGMTSTAEFDIWNPCSTIPFSITMAERTV